MFKMYWSCIQFLIDWLTELNLVKIFMDSRTEMRRYKVYTSWSWFDHFVLHLVKRKVCFSFQSCCNGSFCVHLCLVQDSGLILPTKSNHNTIIFVVFCGFTVFLDFIPTRWWSLWTCCFCTCKHIKERRRKKASSWSQARTFEANYQAIWFIEPIAKERGISSDFLDKQKELVTIRLRHLSLAPPRESWKFTFSLQVSGTIRNCCFEAESQLQNLLLVSEFLWPALLLPVAGNKVNLLWNSAISPWLREV